MNLTIVTQHNILIHNNVKKAINMTFNANEYRNVSRKDLVPMVGDNELGINELIEIAHLTPDEFQESDFFFNRVKRTIRYWLFSKQHHFSGGTDITGKALLLLEEYENTEWFEFIGGWAKYGVSWDIEIEPPFEIIPLNESLMSKWNKLAISQAIPLDDLDKQSNLNVDLIP